MMTFSALNRFRILMRKISRHVGRTKATEGGAKYARSYRASESCNIQDRTGQYGTVLYCNVDR
jgi:hypothetical protein